MASLEGGGNISSRRDPCKKCGLPVFLAERLNVDNHLYHRTCFRCARCSHQLSLANYYETEDSEYCCETCPDEDDTFDQTDQIINNPDTDDLIQPKLLLTQSLSDEEKEHNLNKDRIQSKNYSYEKFTNARSNFVGSQLNVVETMQDNDADDIEGEPPDLPKTNPPDRNDIHIPTIINEIVSLDQVSSGVGSSGEDMSIKESIYNATEHDDSGTSLTTTTNNNREHENSNRRDSVRGTNDTVYIKNSTNNFNDSDSINQPLAADNHTLDAVLDDKKTNDNITEFVTKDDKKTVTISKNGTIFTPDSNFTVAAAANFRLINHHQQLQQQQQESTQKGHFEVAEDYDLPVVVTAMNSELIKKLNHDKNVSFDDSTVLEEPEDENQQQQSPPTILNIEESQKISNSKEQHLDNSNYIPLTIEHKGIKSDVNEKLTDNKDDETKTFDEEKSKKIEKDYPDELNPFDDDDDDNDDFVYEDVYSTNTTSSINLTRKESTNPFGSDDEEDENITNFKENVNERGHNLKKLITSTPKESTNPFGSDDDDEENVSTEENNAASQPVPKPRSILHFDSKKTPEPTPRKVGLNTSFGGFHGSVTSLESSSKSSPFSSPSGTYRKKKPAPPPPSSRDVFNTSGATAIAFKDLKPAVTSPPTVKLRKNRPAPAPPPLPALSLLSQTMSPQSNLDDSSLSTFDEDTAHSSQNTNKINSPTKSTNSEIEKEKNSKDEKNRNRQSMTLTTTTTLPHQTDSPPDSSDISINLSPPNKSTYGKWKRKKGPAPPRPVPQRRQINVLPADELRRQLDIIEIQQQGLEKQGVKLEQIIRLKSEMPGANEDTSLTQEVEDLVLQLFELVNEKNELFRKQAELMYLRRQQRLEEEHADLEYQIRCLMERPESNKTDYDKAREEELINRLIEVVETRNEIIECLEMDRIREAEEDESISTHLNMYAAKRDEDLHSITTSSSQESTKLSKKEKKKQKKIKKTKGITIDADKDVDETEILQKEKKKKMFMLFHV